MNDISRFSSFFTTLKVFSVIYFALITIGCVTHAETPLVLIFVLPIILVLVWFTNFAINLLKTLVNRFFEIAEIIKKDNNLP